MKIWELEDGSKDEEVSALVEKFTAGEDVTYDEKLKDYDVLGSIAHVVGLEEIGVLTSEESSTLQRELAKLLEEEIELTAGDEDVHTKVENLLTQKLGDLGKKLHTGRSRNDQVLVDLRLFEKEKVFEVATHALDLAGSLTDFAREHVHTPMVGYTHTRRAMPSSVGLWAGGYAESLLDDLTALEGTYELIDRSPLGVGAGYGVPLSLDRELTAELLGFHQPANNAINIMNSRGKYEFELLSAVGAIQLDLSRLASDLIDFSEEAYGFFTVPEEFTTGSSIMPQKKNPDVLELVRGKSATLQGYITTLYSLLSGLRSGYSRDLQETKAPLFDGLQIVIDSLAVASPLVDGLKVNEDDLLSHFTGEVFATDRALELVQEGLPFREAYRKVKEELDEPHSSKTPEKEEIKDALAKRDHPGGPGNPGLDTLQEEIGSRRERWTAREEKFRRTLAELADVN